ncbi:MAG: HlyD family efflux transporter periplasmic adaptor subunit [Methylophilaceae bacterium]|jgi:membrane fusion protein (multidrug efflux system)|nr:HlyD family efflux transporter periplasmic adaptor subunit [Methyloradius sp.]
MSESNQTNPTETNGNGKRKLMLIVVAIIALIAMTIWGVYWYLVASHYQSTDDAYVAGNVIQITPQVNGTVVEINADDTDYVTAGKVLVRLDPNDAEVALKQSEAELAQAVRQARTLYANNAIVSASLNERKADLARTKTEVDKAREDLQRRQAVVSTGAVSKEEVEHAQTTLNNALSAMSSAQSGLIGAQEQLTSSHAQTEGTTVETHPNVEAAAAHVREAYLTRERCDITAPAAGQLAKRSVQIGQHIQTGSPLMAIIPLDQLWVDANFKESQLKGMRIGQPVEVYADVYGSKIEYTGHITGLGAGTGAAFSLLPAQNATGNWIKIVQRIPVRIELDKDQLKTHPLRIGLSIDAKVDTSDSSGKLLADVSRTSPVSTTAQMNAQVAAADSLVKDIISKNRGNTSETGAIEKPTSVIVHGTKS